MGCRSLTRGLRSINSRWLCKKARTTGRERPTGSGLIVVNTVLFDIAILGGYGYFLLLGEYDVQV